MVMAPWGVTVWCHHHSCQAAGTLCWHTLVSLLVPWWCRWCQQPPPLCRSLRPSWRRRCLRWASLLAPSPVLGAVGSCRCPGAAAPGVLWVCELLCTCPGQLGARPTALLPPGAQGWGHGAQGVSQRAHPVLLMPFSRWHRGRWALPRARVPSGCCTGALVWLEGDFKPSIRGFNPHGAARRAAAAGSHQPCPVPVPHPPTTPSRPSRGRGPPPCPCPAADSKWGPWNHWSLCSKTCDTGWQRRFRMCEGTGVQGYPCEGTGEEVKTCNEKKCPGTGQPPAPSPGARAAPDPLLSPPSLPRDVQGRVRHADDLEENRRRGRHLQQVSPQRHG